MTYSCKIILDSMALLPMKYGSKQVRLTTFEVTFPRFILAEVNTHRTLSRNSASSRAIPTAKVIARVNDNPFVPAYWGQNQKGMVASQEIPKELHDKATQEWLEARDDAVRHAEKLIEIGVHKQSASRLLEPFIWQTAIISTTATENLFKLRCHPDAQPEFQTIAKMMQDAYKANKPKQLYQGDWHIPYILPEEQDLPTEIKLQIATGRLARVSYETHNGTRDHQEDIRLHDQLSQSGHWSPFEHCAMVDLNRKVASNFDAPWVQYRKFFSNESGRIEQTEEIDV